MRLPASAPGLPPQLLVPLPAVLNSWGQIVSLPWVVKCPLAVQLNQTRSSLFLVQQTSQIRSSLSLVQQTSVEGVCGRWWVSHGPVWTRQSPCSDLLGQPTGRPHGPPSRLRVPGAEGPTECSWQAVERVPGPRAAVTPSPHENWHHSQ